MAAKPKAKKRIGYKGVQERKRADGVNGKEEKETKSD